MLCTEVKLKYSILNVKLLRTMEQSELETEEPSLIETGGMFTFKLICC